MKPLKLDRKEIASVLEEIAVLLELKGENPFKSRAYAAGARRLESLDEDLAALIAEGRLLEVKGIGQALAEKITTLATTGRLPYLDELRAAIPEGLLEMIRVPGLGPRRARVLHDELGIDSIEKLESACRAGSVAEQKGFGDRSQQAILEGIEFIRRQVGKCLLSEADAIAAALLLVLRASPAVGEAQACGSLRRRKEVIGDVDLLATCRRGHNPSEVTEALTGHPGVARVLAAGDTRASVLLESGRQVDLRVVTATAYPFALLYFTGSKEHNIALRRRAQEMGLRINESGLWMGKKRLPCRSEEEIQSRLGLAPIPPELREDAGEIEAAEAGTLPRLVTSSDLRGVFHVHSTWSDGTDTLETMMSRAAAMGYEYVGLSDHSRSAGYAGGLSIERVARQRKEIEGMRRRFPRMRILHGIESDILKDGGLDYPEPVLKRFDFVIGSVHSSFSLTEADQTRRIVRALAHPRLTILGHPTGRLLLQREGFRIDMARIFETAARHGKSIEINANPHRLDLDGGTSRRAKAAGVRLCINPDAHSAEGLLDTAFGVDTARRGWLEPADVLNTRPWEEIRKMMAAGA